MIHPEIVIKNKLILGDNLSVMQSLPSESTDLIYIDPPFFSGRNYSLIFGDDDEVRSFTDIWDGGMPTYIAWLNARLWEMKRLLKPTGNLFVHLDWHAVHYVKVELDKVFGYENFRNEIAWCYTGNQKPKDAFPRKHDSILRYVKTEKATFNRLYEPYSESTIKRYNHVDEDGRRYKLNQYGGKMTKAYMKEEGKPLSDVWSIPHVIPTSSEKIGYPTQKPEELLKNIIISGSNEGDIVADFFSGGGTTCAVAEKLNRRWIGCDVSKAAIEVTKKRLETIYTKKAGIKPVYSKQKVEFEVITL